MIASVRAAAESLYAAAWEARRRCYAAGLAAPTRVGARVVSVGNLTVGGTGKTTLVLHLARLAAVQEIPAAVVCRNYRPGPAGDGDEALLLRGQLPTGSLFAGRNKRMLAQRAAAAGFPLILVDDGFSHWGLERDLDIVLLDSRDLWGGAHLLPAGRLREPRRALQRAQVVVVSRLAPGEDPEPYAVEIRRYAPAARFAAGRHRVTGVRQLDGRPDPYRGRVLMVTGTGNPAAVRASAVETGLDVIELSTYRDHHWFTVAEARGELARAVGADCALVLTAKDAMRWPAAAHDPRVLVLEVEWAWVRAGETVESLVLAIPPPPAGVER